MSARRLEDLMTIVAIARKLKMDRQRLRKMCIAAGIAVGLSEEKKHPRLRAYLSDVAQMINQHRYVPPGITRRQPPRRRQAEKLHRLVNC